METNSETRILIIDDNPGDARLIEIMLAATSLSCRCHKSTDLASGISAVADFIPDLVLLDLGLPQSRGIATLDRFMSSASRVPVVVLSGDDDEKTALAAVKKGAQDYLIKGRVDEELLGRTIRHAIERDLIARKLTESENRYRDLFDNAHDLIMAVAPGGRFLYVNRSWAEVLGHSPEAAADMRLNEILHPGLEDRCDELFFSFTPRNSSCQRELTLVNSKGETVIVEGEISARFDDSGQLESVRAIFRDITARKEAEKEREKIQSQIMSAQKMEAIGTLAGGVAHDFNNILTAILGFADLGLKSLDNKEKLIHHLNSVKKSCGRAAAIVRQLLLFSRKQVMEFKALSLNSVIMEITELLERLIGEGVNMRHQISSATCPVLGDSGSLEQMLMNLVVNARDAMDGSGDIEIGVREARVSAAEAARYRNGRPGYFVELWVRDNG